MKKFYSIIMAGMFAATIQAQEVAMDFTQDDCNGNPHNLFEYLDDNNVVIIEFFMTNCNPCINAGNQLKPHVEELQIAFPGKVEWFHFGFTDSYSCATVSDWVTSNNFPSIPFNNGADMVAYYGGFGMPTIVVVGGPNHDVLFLQVGYSTGDDDEIHDIINGFFGVNGVAAQTANPVSMNAFFNASTETINLELSHSSADDITIEVFSLTGQNVLAAQQLKVNAADQSVQLGVAEITSGIYILKAMVNGKSITQSININR
ncbi:MAG: T9SS type A sorting domain-containing protein [Flavobacteriales bacterium]|nr:T9SS type A sorting domain-containing protein [Flavobacteriales bacterium]